jgi:putative transcription antitermination factor YqgF
MTQKVLGIDYGTTRIGLAIARGPLAEPLTTVANDAETLIKIQKIVDHEQVEKIVIGLSENQMAVKTRAFAQQLELTTKLPIEFVDETLSSYEMHHKLINHKRSIKQGSIDHLVAAQLLQDWLDTQ